MFRSSLKLAFLKETPFKNLVYLKVAVSLKEVFSKLTKLSNLAYLKVFSSSKFVPSKEVFPSNLEYLKSAFLLKVQFLKITLSSG